MNYTVKSLFLFICIFLTGYSQNKSNNIARIGNQNISSEEFKFRYELSPMVLPKEFASEDSLKKIFLYSIIAEKLWAMEAIDEGLNTSERFKFYFNPLKKALVRDKLFEKEIKSKVSVSNDDLIDGIKKFQIIPKVEILSFPDSADAFHLYNELVELGSIDSLVKTDTTLDYNIDTVEIRFSTLKDEQIEDKIFNLAPSRFLKPLKYEGNWFIFQVDSIKPNIIHSSPQSLTKEVKDLIKDRRINNLYEEYYAKVFSGYSIEANEKLFELLSNTVYDVLSSKFAEIPQIPDSQKIYLSESDINDIMGKLPKRVLDSTIFTTEYSPVTLNDFLSDLTLIDTGFPNLERGTIRRVLSNKLKLVMQQETLYQMGERMGLGNSVDVQSQLAPWKDNILAQLKKNTFNSTIKITDEEILKHYNSVMHDSALIINYKYSMISSRSLKVIQNIFNDINNGKDFETIKSNYADSDSVTFIVSDEFSNPIVNKIKSQLFTTELSKNVWYGPININNTFNLIKILETEEASDSIKNKFEQVKEQIRSNLFFEKLNQELEAKTVKLATKFGVRIYESELNKLTLTKIPMFVHRFLGFGGRIAAVPVTIPFYKWYYKWTSETKINP